MKRILFAWELGANLGHLHTINGPARILKERGHWVGVLSQNITSAARVFKDSGIKVFQTPIAERNRLNPFDGTNPPDLVEGYVDAIAPYGFQSVETLSAAISAWRNQLAEINPDVIVFNASPVGLLASKGLYCVATLGTGYHTLPDDMCPLPAFDSDFNSNQLSDRENKLLETINEVSNKIGSAKLFALCDIFKVHRNILTTFRELDHYPKRNAIRSNYRGPQFSTTGIPFKWPEGKIRVFIYARGQRMDLIFSELQKSSAFQNKELSIVCSKGGASLKDASDADVAITYGSHGVTAAMLLAGVPVIVIPSNTEQLMTTKAVIRLEAGMMGFTSGNLIEMIHETIKLKNGAMKFRDKYKWFNCEEQTESIAGTIENLA